MRTDDTAELVRQHLARLYPLNQLGETALARLLPKMRVVQYLPKAPLYAAGDSPSDLFYVLQGCVVLYDRDSWAAQLTIRPDPHDEAMPLPLADPSDERAVVAEDSLVLHVDRALLASVMPRAAAPGKGRPSGKAAEAGPAPAPSAAAPATPAKVSSRVLLVEHVTADAEACRTLVKRLGWHIDWVPSAEEALELLRLEDYGAVLLDLQLPHGDGFDVVRWIREREPGAHRPRIIALAEPGHDDRDGCLAAGMDDVICKPLAAHILRPKLAPVLAKAP